MKRVHPFWSPERAQAYTEAALIVCAKGKEGNLTERGIIQQLGSEALGFARQLAHGPDETFRDTFIEDLSRDEIIDYDSTKRLYSLAHWGDLLVINFLEEWAGNP